MSQLKSTVTGQHSGPLHFALNLNLPTLQLLTVFWSFHKERCKTRDMTLIDAKAPVLTEAKYVMAVSTVREPVPIHMQL